MKFYGEEDALFEDFDRADFLFLPAHAFTRLPIPAAELAVNLASFQEMTTAQVKGYADKLADSGCPQLYSLNRDRSRYNPELSTVTGILETRYRVERLEVLDVPYTVLGSKTPKEPEAADYRHLIGRL
jgi:hypothetical protein